MINTTGHMYTQQLVLIPGSDAGISESTERCVWGGLMEVWIGWEYYKGG